MITLDIRPINLVEGVSFCSLLQYLEPGYEMLSRKYFSQVITDSHDVGKAKLRALMHASRKLALTTDIWTTSTTGAYITVASYLITSSWYFLSFVVQPYIAFPEHHTGVAISVKLRDN